MQYPLTPLLPCCGICYSCLIFLSQFWQDVLLVMLHQTCGAFICSFASFAGKFEPSGRKKGMKAMKMTKANMKVKPNPRTLIGERGEGWAASLTFLRCDVKNGNTKSRPYQINFLNYIIRFYHSILSKVVSSYHSQVPHKSLVISLIFEKMWPLPMVRILRQKWVILRVSCCKWCHHMSPFKLVTPRLWNLGSDQCPLSFSCDIFWIKCSLCGHWTYFVMRDP